MVAKKAGLAVEEIPSLLFWIMVLGGSIYITGILIDKVKDEVGKVMA